MINNSVAENLLKANSDAVPCNSVCVACNAFGNVTPMTAKHNKDEFVIAPFLLNLCSGHFTPPAKNAHPNTRSMFEKIDPTRDNCTTLNNPSLSAKTETIISVAFPNVAFNNPPIVCDVCLAISSVTYPNRSARGHRANNANANAGPSPKLNVWHTIPKGANRSNAFNFVPNKTVLKFSW